MRRCGQLPVGFVVPRGRGPRLALVHAEKTMLEPAVLDQRHVLDECAKCEIRCGGGLAELVVVQAPHALVELDAMDVEELDERSDLTRRSVERKARWRRQ